MKTIENKIVFSNDIKQILNGNNPLNYTYFNGSLPNTVSNTIDELRENFEKDVSEIFNGKYEIISEEDMQSSITLGTNKFISKLPIVTLDAIYLKPNNESIYFLDCTRLDIENNLVARNNMNDPYNVETQISKLSNLFKLQNQKEIIIADDVIYSGSVIEKITTLFNKYGIKVVSIIAAISTIEAKERLLKSKNTPIFTDIILGNTTIDQICERDFYFGIVGSGIATRTESKIIKKAPYFYPFGDPITRASIPKDKATYFSQNCLIRSLKLWESINKITTRYKLIKDLPEQIANTNPEEAIIYTLKKGIK